MPTGVDPNDIFHNGYWYNRNGSGGPATLVTDSSGNTVGIADPVGGGVIRLQGQKVGNTGTRVFSILSAASPISSLVPGAAQTTGQPITFGATMEVEAEFDWVRLVLLNSTGATLVVANATGLPTGDLSSVSTQLNNTGFASPSTFLFNGSNTVTMPSGTVNAPALVLSDKLYISSVPRTDGGTRPALCARVAFSAGASGASTQIPYWSRLGADWVSGIGKFYSYQSTAATDTTTGTITGASASATGNSPIFGIQYGSKRQVMNTFWLGDSITAAASLTTRKARGFAAQSALMKSTAARPIEFCVAGFSGQLADVWRTFAEAAYAGATGGTTDIASGATNLDVLKPSHCFMSSWSVNDASTATITTGQINSMRRAMVRLLSACKDKGVTPIFWNGIPKGNGGPFYDVTDVTFRQAYNTDALSWGWISYDIGSVIASDVAGQRQGIAATYTGDGVHPNDAGDVLVTAQAATLVSAAAASYFP